MNWGSSRAVKERHQMVDELDSSVSPSRHTTNRGSSRAVKEYHQAINKLNSSVSPSRHTTRGSSRTVKEHRRDIDELNSPVSPSRRTTNRGSSRIVNHETRSERDFWRPDSEVASLTPVLSHLQTPMSVGAFSPAGSFSTTPQSTHVRWTPSVSDETPWAGLTRSSVSPAPTLESEDDSETDTQNSSPASPDSEPDSNSSSNQDSDPESDIIQSLAIVKKVQWMKNHDPFVIYKKTSKAFILVPPEFSDLRPGALFVRLDPDTLDIAQTWVWTQERVWRHGQDGDVHPILSQHRLSLRRIDGKLTVNWVLKSSYQAYKQRARKAQMLSQVCQLPFLFF